MIASRPKQALRWLVKRLKAEAKRAVMHRDQGVRMQLKKCFHCLLRVHMNFAASWRVVSTNGKQCDVNVKAVADFLEPGEIGSVATVKNGAAIGSNHE